MNIASLFVTMGLKGNNEAVKGIQNIRGQLNEAKSVTLGWRAAMLGVVYGLQKWMSNSTSQGMALKQFADYTGLSIDQLQRWQYLFKKSGVEAAEVEQSLVGLQNTLTKFQMGEDLPAGFEQISTAVGGIDTSKLNDTFYVMQKMREYAQKETNVGVRNVNLQSMGYSPKAIQALATSSVVLDKIPKSLLMNENQVKSLTKVEERWVDVQQRLNAQMNNFMAKHGPALVTGAEAIASAIIKIGDAMMKVEEKFKIFEKIAWFFTEFSKSIDFFSKNISGEKGDVKQFFENIPDLMKLMIFGDDKAKQQQKDRSAEIFKNNPAFQKTLQQEKNKTSQSIQIKQELIFSGPQDAQAVAQYHRDGAEEAYRQTFGQVAFS
jgi:hypothetical protein